MKISKEFKSWSEVNYGVIFALLENNRNFYCFLNTEKICKENTAWIDINNLNSKEFLKENDIEFIIEKDGELGENKVIPIGLIDFNSNNSNLSNVLPICNFDGVDLEKANIIIANIEKAIKIKYEAYKFKKKFENQTEVEYIELD
ncbi:MAG: hypothetical protein H7Y18_20590 [Clostridiaceae bacterium]|nr:hypothetical protein [Clostridiaceae bacterium]